MKNSLVVNGPAASELLSPGSLACHEMPELIVMHLLGDLPDDLRFAIDGHLDRCPRCAAKRRALEAAACSMTARRRGRP